MKKEPMLKVGNSYSYFWVGNPEPINVVTIDHIYNNIAIVKRPAIMDFEAGQMTFDSVTGNGIGEYSGTYLKPINEPGYELINKILEVCF